jgi:hypothetical protein
MRKYICLFFAIAFLGCSPEKETIEIVGFSAEEFDLEAESLRMTMFHKGKEECYHSLSTYRSDEYEFIKPLIYKRISDSIHFYITCNYDGTILFNQLHKSVDIATLKDLGDFWTDKNAVYYEYFTSSGMALYRLAKVDRGSFEVFENSVYGKDKNHVYSSRFEIVEGADLETFQPVKIDEEEGKMVYGKDKTNKFFWSSKYEEK